MQHLFRVLTITTDQQRVRTIKAASRALSAPHGSGSSLFLFATFNDLSATSPLAFKWVDGNDRKVELIGTTDKWANSAEKIRTFNDAFRRSLAGGKVMMTAGIAAFSAAAQAKVLNEARSFDGNGGWRLGRL
jgi:hypothetical protein